MFGGVRSWPKADAAPDRVPKWWGGGNRTQSPGINASAPEKKTATAGVAVKLVEAAGQPIRPFRDGLDYAFILVPGCGACYPAGTTPDPSARPA